MNGSALFLDSKTKAKFNSKTNAKKIRNIERMVVKKDLTTREIHHFIMVIRGAYDYLMKTKTVGENTYLHSEPDFDRDVYFYIPGAGLEPGYHYKAGKKVSQISSGIEGDNRTGYTLDQNTVFVINYKARAKE